MLFRSVEALSLWNGQPQPIHILVSDVVMPEGISGKELADQLLLKQPTLKVILTSGYSLDEIGGDDFSADGYRFLQKPYNHLSLARAVREMLDA